MKTSKRKKIEVQPHWRGELTKVRCWISGWEAGRRHPGSLNALDSVPGDDVLRQIIMAIDDAKEN